MYALDTGFFYQLLVEPDDARVQQPWREIGEGGVRCVLSYVVCYELCRHALRGSLPRAATELLVRSLPDIGIVVAVDDVARCERTARLAHGNGLAMADAFVLEAALSHDTARLYTTDSDFKGYEGPIDIVLL